MARVDPTGVGDVPRRFLAGLAWKVALERCAQLGSLLASYAIEVVGTQEYRFGETFLTRFEDAYGTEAASDIAPHLGQSPAVSFPGPWVIGSARAEQLAHRPCRHCGRAGQLDAFLAATEENAAASRNGRGIVRFDALSDRADPTHVVLVEIYRDEVAAAAHKDAGIISGGATPWRP